MKLIEFSEFEQLPDNLAGLERLRGGYSAVFKEGREIIGVRDVLGIVPLFYTPSAKFSDERKLLCGSRELNPRKQLRIARGIQLKPRGLPKTTPRLNTAPQKIVEHLAELVVEAVMLRAASINGVMFSGGIDSSLIAFILKRLGKKLECFTAGVELGKLPEDVVWARRVAKALGLPLRVKLVKLSRVEQLARRLIPIIESNNIVKLGVALPEFVAASAAVGIRRLFSGLGSEELFAGYQRHRKAKHMNAECRRGLLMMYKRDTYRDYTIAKHLGKQFVVPFLDKAVVEYSLRIPPELKLSAGSSKLIIRYVARHLGIPTWIAQRPKRAAQYGSNFDRAISRIAKQRGYLKKSDYLSAIAT